MNETPCSEIWFCEDCRVVEATAVAQEDRDLRSVLYAIERAHRTVSPRCCQPVGCLRVINRRRVKSRADLEADNSVPRWVIEPIMRLLEMPPDTQTREPPTSPKEEERVRLHVYPSMDVRQVNALQRDTRLEALARYEGKEGNGETYSVLAVQVEPFKQLAQQQYGCIVLSDVRVQLFLREQIW